ncbi:hypothetical protein SISSUDRAFT_1039835 [Sistotremastrum suecicum HHB10207 ss-3]|uniref:Roadblock/LAMTOR2 domain-containing protein n=1 Tax=Sistotremastrum suecicum HHB10207 ss-3 TaxID=1314776 RepID=A0A166INE8_9AGAM|nr:hypothetical protein SISSUDRAFT_1039835 [Sistotremastrum suecicum HHB10207 ss-3]
MPSQGTSTTDVVSQNGPSSTSSSTNAPVSPELEQILSSLTTNRSVLGYIVLTRTSPIGIVRHSGVVFDGEQGKKYASAVKRIVDAVRVGLEDVSGAEGVRYQIRLDWCIVNEQFLRIG